MFIILRRYKNGPTSLIEVYPDSKRIVPTGVVYTIKKKVIHNNDERMVFKQGPDRVLWNTYNPETKKLGSPRMYVDINIGNT